MSGFTELAKQLIPFAPVPRKVQLGDLEEVNRIVEKLGFNGTREAEREEVFSEFRRVGGSETEGMTEEHFIAVAAQLWGLDRLAARSIFHASDLHFSGRLNRIEYLLMKEAFIHHSPSDQDTPEEIMELQLRAAFNRYVLSRPAQRVVKGTVLTSAEVSEFVRDLCAGDTHVKKVASQLLPQLMPATSPGGSPSPPRKSSVASDSGDDLEQAGILTVNDFVGTLMQEQFKELFATLDLSPQDLVHATLRGHRSGKGRGHPGMTCSRVVLDGRAESAQMKWVPPPAVDDMCIEEALQYAERKKVIDSDCVPSDAINEEMVLVPQVRAVGGWRGPLAPSRDKEEYQLASRVIENAQRLARDVSDQQDVLDKEWYTSGEAMEALAGSGEGTQANALVCLARACEVQLRVQSNLVRVQAPSKVFGDIHGQFRDLLLLLDQFGFPSHCGGDIQTTSYVFNGDFVDRGDHQLEVLMLLFALKVVYPSHIFLIRGNHEFREMSEIGSPDCFLRHCKWRLPQQWKLVYEAVHKAFDWLPMAALVGGRALVLHGGLGDGKWGLKEIEEMQRPLVKPRPGIELDIVWSDPSDSDHIMWKGVHSNPDRGDTKIHLFGPDVTAAFCEREGVCVVIRSHQFVSQGYKVMHSGRLLTVFSARNYCGDDENDGALLLLAPDHNGHLRVHPKRLLALPILEDGEAEEEEELRRLLAAGQKGNGSWIPSCFSGCFSFLSSQ